MEIETENGYSATNDVVLLDRIGAHSHITGLGLGDNLQPTEMSNGMVGQLEARKAAGIIAKMVKNSKVSGQTVLITGQPGTGKTAIAMGLCKELGPETPFVSLSATEVYSLDISKTETLTQALRRCMGIRIKEETEVIEGEIVELIIDRAYDDIAQKAGKITLKTTDMEAVYDLGTKMIDLIQKEKITAGDVISIVKATGKVTKLGRSYSRAQDYDATSVTIKYVPCPQGELNRKKEIVHIVTLHEIDVINSRTQGFMALFSGDIGEVKSEVREQINIRIHEWVQEGKAELVAGVLFIDEVHLLDIECFSFLNRALEDVLCPIVVLATNRGVSRIRGTNLTGPHGLPFDLLDRTLIIKTIPYSEDELRSILKLRCEEENVTVENDALELLTKISFDNSLRYAMQLIQTSYIMALRERKSAASIAHVQKSFYLFSDEKRSIEKVIEHKNDFLYSEELVEDVHSMKLLNQSSENKH